MRQLSRLWELFRIALNIASKLMKLGNQHGQSRLMYDRNA